jgi:hypothetical protein
VRAGQVLFCWLVGAGMAPFTEISGGRTVAGASFRDSICGFNALRWRIGNPANDRGIGMGLARARRTAASMAAGSMLLVAAVSGVLAATTSSAAAATPTIAEGNYSCQPVQAAAVANTPQVNVCVGVAPLQPSRERGQAAHWAVDAWTTGGNVPDVKLQLQATPADAGTPSFSFGCGQGEGTASCDLGAVDATATIRELQAQIVVPATASTVTSASLTATGSAANLGTAPEVSEAITILAPPVPAEVAPTPAAVSPTPAGTTALALPTLPLSSPSPSPSPSSVPSAAGNASGLFPTVSPQSSNSQSSPQSPASPRPSLTGQTEQVANTFAAPAGGSTAGAQVVGLVALALAVILAVTRVSMRRPTPGAAASKKSAAPPPKAPAKPDSEPKGADEPPATPEA